MMTHSATSKHEERSAGSLNRSKAVPLPFSGQKVPPKPAGFRAAALPLPVQRQLPDLWEAVEAIQAQREDGQSQRIKLSGCPPYLICEWQLIHERARVETGAGLTACILHGLDEINTAGEVKEFRRIAGEIRRADHRMLSMQARTLLRKLIGTSQRPGLSFDVANPFGTPEPLQFRSPQKYHPILAGQAEEFGISISSLGIVALGIGLDYYSEHSLDPESAAAIFADRDSLVRKLGAQAKELRRHFKFYRGGGGT